MRYVLKTCALLGALSETLLLSWAHAGPCTSKIAQFEKAVRQSAGNPNAGPVAPQSIDAQLDRQPTPALIERAGAGASDVLCDVGARRATRCTRQSRRAHAGLGRQANVQSVMIN